MTKEEKRKLLEDFGEYLLNHKGFTVDKMYLEGMAIRFLSSNNLNPVEPEPFTGIKGDGNKCEKGGKFPCLPNLKYNLLHCTDCDKTE